MHPKIKFIQKNDLHSGIKPLLPRMFPKVPNNSFVQELLEPPFLVKHVKMDYSKSVMIYCLNPLQ